MLNIGNLLTRYTFYNSSAKLKLLEILKSYLGNE